MIWVSYLWSARPKVIARICLDCGRDGELVGGGELWAQTEASLLQASC
jgi:hypothetical protein